MEKQFYGSLLHYSNEDFVSLVDSKYGWSVSEQAESILNGENYEDQNENALEYIRQFAVSKKETELADSIKEYLSQIEQLRKD